MLIHRQRTIERKSFDCNACRMKFSIDFDLNNNESI